MNNAVFFISTKRLVHPKKKENIIPIVPHLHLVVSRHADSFKSLKHIVCFGQAQNVLNLLINANKPPSLQL